MPGKCPACRTEVQHPTDLPRTDRVYRCPVCRLQMTYDPVNRKMQPYPDPAGPDDNKTRNDV